MKIAALTPVSGPYVVARYAAFAAKFPDISLFLVELGQTSATYPWKHPDFIPPYQRIILSEQPLEHQSIPSLFQSITQTLDQIEPELIILCGYAEPAMFSAMLWSLWHQKPAVLLSATKEDDARRFWLSETIKGGILKLYKAALVGGKPQKRYLVKLGMNPKSVFTGYNVVGNENFGAEQLKFLPQPYKNPYFLTINRFVPKKNLLRLVTSYAAYRQIAGDRAWDLVLCGDGELRSPIEQQIIALNLQDYVHLPGFLQQNELLPYLAHASCFVHASIQEQWGLVVNEAMAAGLPALVSNRCGCFEDLVIEGVNGFGFDPDNSSEITNLMLKISSEEVNLKQMGEAALEHIQKFSPDYFAQNLMQAVNYAIAHS
ncbi:glycosyltransferase family 4 protein [Merismopedia glauca]|uniref:Hexosyltransferase n=1 Tax=Merismopedia glauca CCAP 1448/3 TaxID=1296344 RepID=A0A2T1C723_9CYAN|nr:glycosyltransferase family 4 protein [Merismopedia glauca]PSB04085.1 hexosyltransferase [Merismopedia glauca CCAP 1448/3]